MAKPTITGSAACSGPHPSREGGWGSYAEQHVADVELVGRKPENLSHLEAASPTLAGGTVWEAFVTRAQLAVLDALTNLVQRGLVKPVLRAVLPLARIGDAHELLEDESTDGLRGKIAIDTGPKLNDSALGRRALRRRRQ